MTTQTITGPYPSGYRLHVAYSGLNIAKTASVGGNGVYAELAANIYNYGQVKAGSGQDGVYLNQGGLLANETQGYVGGDRGMDARLIATINNFGTISGIGYGVYLKQGGLVINQPSGKITTGYVGVDGSGGSTTVANYGLITSPYPSSLTLGVRITAGMIQNGSDHYTSATIDAFVGVQASASATVSNFGSIGYFGGFYGGGAGVQLLDGGTVVNGDIGDRGALIQGFGFGVQADGASGTVRNFGTIDGAVSPDFTHGGEPRGGFVGVVLDKGAMLQNGSVLDTTALVEGYGYGVTASGGATVTNYGTIEGLSGTAVYFTDSSDLLVVEAGSVFLGTVNGGGGTVELASGSGTLSALAGGDVTATVSMVATTFTDFGIVAVGQSADFTLSGTGSVISGQTLETVGELTLTGALGGAGTLDFAGGASTFAAGSSLSIAKVDVSGALTTITLADSIVYAKDWDQTGGVVSVNAGDKLTFEGSGDDFTGAVAGSGSVEFFGHSDTFKGLTLSAKSQSIAAAASITLSGAITITTTLLATSPNLVISGGATLTGGGEFEFSNTASNAIAGASTTTRLTNVDDRFVGAGQLGGGKMILINDASATIDGDDTLALTINTGTERIDNAGLIESTDTGGLVIDSAIDNTGTLTADKGVLSVQGAVSGAGAVRITGGTADFASTFTQNVAFTTGGTLELAQSQSYKGTITGFSMTGAASLDLLDIAFGPQTKATFSGTANSGTLIVTDGTHTARIKLTGNYTASTFTVSSDGHGGTKVVDPTEAAGGSQISPAPLHAFAAGMAGFGPAGGGSIGARSEPWRAPAPALLSPRTQIA